MGKIPTDPVTNVNNTRSIKAGTAMTALGAVINWATMLYEWFVNGIKINDDIPVETLEQDNMSPTLIWFMNQVKVVTSIVGNYNLYDTAITVVSSVGMLVGHKYSVLNVAGDRVDLGEIVNIVGNVITLDSPLAYEFQDGDPFVARSHNLAVDGSVTTQKFIMRGVDIDIPGIVDITRIIITCLTDGPVILSKFGDLPALIKGLVLRRENGYSNNIFNVKTNAELAGIMFDFMPYAATNPAQGQNGFVCRLTFNGQEKMGVVVRIGPDDEMVALVQDDLSDLQELFITLEGHFVENGS